MAERSFAREVQQLKVPAATDFLGAGILAVTKALLEAGGYTLAVELLRCRRLIKGYSDTHARGSSRFDRLLHAAALPAGRDDAGPSLATLREAALRDAEGRALDQALQAMRVAA